MTGRGTVCLLFLAACWAAPAAAQGRYRPSAATLSRWRHEAAAVTVTRDRYGIAHVYGASDADAVFGMEYAQAEDDFHRVEMNYINALGWLAQAEGRRAVFQDLRMRLFIDPAVMKAKYAASPAWLRRLMNAFADGLNYYLYTHPRVRPLLIRHFRPWMALAFSEGSIGGDITEIPVSGLAAFYGRTGRTTPAAARLLPPPEPGGSNGIAIAPKLTVDHHALLYINPHVSFYFRAELQMASASGLDAYGAVTWGQFFIYQGFNRGAGWMHTSSGVQNVDRFWETVARRDGRWEYKYGDQWLPMRTRRITVAYKTPSGLAHRTFTTYYTQHGPVIARQGARWMTVHLMQRPMRALEQDWDRMTALDYAAFRRTMQLHTNSSNNTIFADSEGNIAYWHSDYIPRRSDQFNWFQPVDGSNPATAYHGLLTLAETPHLLNPPNGWLYNSNNWPWSAAGKYSPKRRDFPRYVEKGTEESPRGYHALRLLTGSKDWTAHSLVAAGFDGYLPAFARLIPVLLRAYDGLPAGDPRKAELAPEATVLREWNYRWGIHSVATSLAVFWGTDIYHRLYPAARAAHMSIEDYVAERAKAAELVGALAEAAGRIQRDFGTWQTPWGNINRFERLDDSIRHPHFSDAAPSIPVPFVSSLWGSLAAYGSRPWPGTKKWYGTVGNSFVCVVEFGPRVRAWAVSTGGESGDPKSPHFDDQAVRYATGNLRPVYFYPAQIRAHARRVYHPGA
ncbi:MAG: penicillin acylase family protein [Terriglobales bacterium]